MAGSGYKVFTAGEVLTAANVNGYLMEQSVMVFAGTAARGSALGTAVAEGMMSYLADTNAVQVYDGSNWVAVGVDTSIASSIVTTSVATAAATATTYTAGTVDRNNVVYSLATATITVTVPDVFNTGDRIDFVRDGAGTVTIAAGTGVTSWAGAGTAGTAVTFKIDQQYNAATVLKVAANTYRVVGKITV
jgi:hypothetical protein